jgi:hypothetical protein
MFGAQAFANNIRLGTPASGGTGCPVGSAAIVLSPDEQAISILFDKYVVEAGYTNGRRVDRKSCNLVVPIEIPEGYTVALIKADYRGFNAIPEGGKSRFNAESFWAGERGPALSKTFRGPLADHFLVEDNQAVESLVFTPCGQSVNLRVNTSLLVATNESFDQALSAVDSADLSGALVYHFTMRQCR